VVPADKHGSALIYRPTAFSCPISCALSLQCSDTEGAKRSDPSPDAGVALLKSHGYRKPQVTGAAGAGNTRHYQNRLLFPINTKQDAYWRVRVEVLRDVNMKITEHHYL
jgi:hypothetical protein